MHQAGLCWFKLIKADLFDHLEYDSSPLDPCFFMKRETREKSAATTGVDSVNEGECMGTDVPIFTSEPDDSRLEYTGRFVVVCLYVDDLFCYGNWTEEVGKLKERLRSLYQCTDFDPPSWFLGWKIDVNEEEGTVKLSQGRLIREAIERFGLKDKKARSVPVPPNHVFESPDPTCLLSPEKQVLYMEKLGVCNYLATQVCGIVAYGVSKLGQFMQQADLHHMDAAGRILVWLGAHADDGIVYIKHKSSLVYLHAYSDASYADKGQTGTSDSNRRRSQTGIVILLCGCLIHWRSVGQKTVALSTCESELIALTSCCQEVVFFRRTLEFLGFKQREPTAVAEDNTAAEAICSSQIATKRSRFIDVRYHYCRQMQAEGEIRVYRCDTKLMRADMFTKALSREVLLEHWLAVASGTEHGLATAKQAFVVVFDWLADRTYHACGIAVPMLSMLANINHTD